MACCAGLSASSILWGPWAVGMAAAKPAILARFRKAGLQAFTPVTGLRALSAAMASTCTNPLTASIAWEVLLQAQSTVSPVFDEFLPAQDAAPAPVPGARQKTSAEQGGIAIHIEAVAPSVKGHQLTAEELEISVGQVAQIVQSMLGRSVPATQVRPTTTTDLAFIFMHRLMAMHHVHCPAQPARTCEQKGGDCKDQKKVQAGHAEQQCERRFPASHGLQQFEQRAGPPALLRIVK